MGAMAITAVVPFFFAEGADKMAKNREFKGYISVTLSKKQRQDVTSLAGDLDELISAMESMLEDGQSISVRYDAIDDCYVSSVNGYNDVRNAGYSMSTRAGSIIKALAGGVYKSRVHFGGGEWSKPKSSDDIL